MHSGPAVTRLRNDIIILFQNGQHPVEMAKEWPKADQTPLTPVSLRWQAPKKPFAWFEAAERSIHEGRVAQDLRTIVTLQSVYSYQQYCECQVNAAGEIDECWRSLQDVYRDTQGKSNNAKTGITSEVSPWPDCTYLIAHRNPIRLVRGVTPENDQRIAPKTVLFGRNLRNGVNDWTFWLF